MDEINQNEQATVPLPHLDELRVGIVVADSKIDITEKLCASTVNVLKNEGYPDNDITVVHVPDTFQLLFAASRLAKSRAYDVVVLLGCVIRGETPHFEYECQHISVGSAMLNVEGKIPVVFGVLTTDNEEQAWQRVGGPGAKSDKGAEAAIAAIRMAYLARKF